MPKITVTISDERLGDLCCNDNTQLYWWDVRQSMDKIIKAVVDGETEVTID